MAYTPATRAPVPENTDHDYTRLFNWLCEQRGLGAGRYRPSIVRRRRGACLRAVGAASVADAHTRTAGSPRLVDNALSAVLIGVTSFFRDAAPFEALANELARPENPLRQRPLTVLSVGCSDGQELYSTGIVLAEAGLLSRTTLWGVDCRGAAIEHARAGRYPVASLDEMSLRRRNRWFDVSKAEAVVRSELRDRTRWAVGDAFSFEEPAKADIVLCRNLVIYLEVAAAAEIWRSLVARLRPGGLLIVGKAERPACSALLTRIGTCMYRKMES